ncbi:AAA family ATPase [Candidatus Cloacimonadota bacterium]|nr:AAA family ATPase [Candidatus Cloacimonadota bacterium]
MYISKLVIRNYRNFDNAFFTFSSGVNTIIGENGSGKTNLFRSIQILFDETLPRNLRLYEDDFNRGLNNWKGHWIIIKAELSELDTSDPVQCLAIHSTGLVNESGLGTYAMYYRPTEEVRKSLFDYSKVEGRNKEDLASILNNISIDDYEMVFMGKGNADFSDEIVYKALVGDFENITFPDPADKDIEKYGDFLPQSVRINKEVSCTFIKALRDVESDLRNYRSNPLLSLLRGKEKNISFDDRKPIEEQVKQLNDDIGELHEVNALKIDIKAIINSVLGNLYAPNVDVKSELPTEMDELIRSLKLWVGDPEDGGHTGKITEISLGGANLIYLSLKLLENDKLKQDKGANFLLIEEPEAHIHTHIQKTLFNNLDSTRTQIFVSTHSTHISSVSKISQVNVLCRQGKTAIVFQPHKGLKIKQIERAERYLDAVRSNLLFAKGVLLVEGDAEQILIPEMFKEVMGLTLDEVGITIVNVGSTAFSNIANLFHHDRIRKYCAIVTDSDISIIPLAKEKDSFTEEMMPYYNSQKSGKERRGKLDDLCKDNSYLKAYYAEHTFEVDFLRCGNAYEVKRCVDNLFKKGTKTDLVKHKLDDDKVAISGKEVMRLAKKAGKGWFALLLAEQCNFLTEIPHYIIEALAHASNDIGDETIKKSIQYRINQFRGNSDYTEQIVQYDENASKLGVIELYKSVFHEDTLTVLINVQRPF